MFFFVKIQQDSYCTPAHRGRETLELLRTETLNVTSLDLLSPNSPDLGLRRVLLCRVLEPKTTGTQNWGWKNSSTFVGK